MRGVVTLAAVFLLPADDAAARAADACRVHRRRRHAAGAGPDPAVAGAAARPARPGRRRGRAAGGRARERRSQRRPRRAGRGRDRRRPARGARSAAGPRAPRSNRIWEQLGRSQDELEPPSAAYRRLRLQMLAAERSSILRGPRPRRLRRRGAAQRRCRRSTSRSRCSTASRTPPPGSTRSSPPPTQRAGECEHLRDAPRVVRRARRTAARSACATAPSWVHLRLCLACGHVGCCDSSIGKHAARALRRDAAPGHALHRAGRGVALVLRGRPARLIRTPCRN